MTIELDTAQFSLDFSNDRQTTLSMHNLFRVDEEFKPTDYNDTVAGLVALLEDGAEARDLTRTFLRTLKLGLKANHKYPLQHGTLRYLIDRLAGRYSETPTRSLRLDRKELASGSQDHKAMLELYEDSEVDPVMGLSDRYSTLAGSVFIRVYPTDDGPRLRMFTGDLVARVPSFALADDIRRDHVIALRLSNDIWEVHTMKPGRKMFLVKAHKDDKEKDGYRYTKIPSVFERGYPAEYKDVLPIFRLDSEPLAGRAWLQPRMSRAAYSMALAGLHSDIQALTAKQVHNLLVYKTVNPNNPIPDKLGPGAAIKIGDEDSLDYVVPQSFIADIDTAVKRLTTSFLMGERIPRQEAEGGQTITGAELRIAERPLASYRKDSRPLAIRAERHLWEIMRTISNAHGFSDTEFRETRLYTVLGLGDQVEDDSVILANGTSGMAIGVLSPVDIAERLHRVGRDRAIAILERVRQDIERFPAMQTNAGQVDDSPEDVAAKANGEKSADSMADLANNKTAAEAREERRQNDSAGT